jgi:hypothetical protein
MTFWNIFSEALFNENCLFEKFMLISEKNAILPPYLAVFLIKSVLLSIFKSDN